MRERLSDKANWCVGLINDFSTELHQVCVLGAILEVRTGVPLHNKHRHPDRVEAAYQNVPKALAQAAVEVWNGRVPKGDEPGSDYVWRVNDLLGHAATLSMLDRAIEIEQQQQHA